VIYQHRGSLCRCSSCICRGLWQGTIPVHGGAVFLMLAYLYRTRFQRTVLFFTALYCIVLYRDSGHRPSQTTPVLESTSRTIVGVSAVLGHHDPPNLQVKVPWWSSRLHLGRVLYCTAVYSAVYHKWQISSLGQTPTTSHHIPVFGLSTHGLMGWLLDCKADIRVARYHIICRSERHRARTGSSAESLILE
jgi:hypothetical protein